jgi:predicted transcriptional regulator
MRSTYITYRSKYEIAYDILRIVNDNPIIKRRYKTGIGYAAGLTHWLTVKYLRGLIDQGLLRISHDAGPYRHYEITPKGIRYLQLFDEIEDGLRPKVITSNF